MSNFTEDITDGVGNVNISENEGSGDGEAPKPVKLPYFHRKLSAEDTALIGDIQPKRVENDSEATEEDAPKKLSDISSWNSAGTWESKDITKWAKARLEALVPAGIKLESNSQYTIEITESSVEGMAEITLTRGKVRYVYDMTLSLKLSLAPKVASSGKACKGSLSVSSIMNADLEDADYELTWSTGSAPVNAHTTLVRGLLLKEGELRTMVRDNVATFHEEMRDL